MTEVENHWLHGTLHGTIYKVDKLHGSSGNFICKIRVRFWSLKWSAESCLCSLSKEVNFEIGMNNIAIVHFEELLLQLKITSLISIHLLWGFEFKGVAKVGELVNFEAGMDIMDLLYEKEETSMLYTNPGCFIYHHST